ncbi:MAG: type IVB secretion system protein IcmH/DotU [Rhodospirillales bacterium]|nr:type IVB secretion system protein IcmH/DotU [Rhodospirillales bacterium]
MSDNPFSQPEDDERTIIRPMPGRRPASPLSSHRASRDSARAPASPKRFEPEHPGFTPPDGADGAQPQMAGTGKLTAAAAPLLQLLGRLQNTSRPPNVRELRERAIQELRRFEQRARADGYANDQLRPAHYALCASLDDVVLNTPWGSSGGWEDRSLVSTFHQEVSGGERFFDVLRQVKQEPNRNLPVIELMYFCLSLGFLGRYRVSPRGRADFDSLREDTYTLLMRHRAPTAVELSPHWQGVSAPYRPSQGSVPLWVAASGGATAIAGLYVWFLLGTNTASDTVYARLLGKPWDHMPQIARVAPVQAPVVIPAAPEPGVLDRLRAFLRPEIQQRLVSVVGTSSTPIIRISNPGLFASGSATVQPGFKSLLERIGAAMRTEPGSIRVIGYTDNQPIRTVQFPSNFRLSVARAEATAAIIANAVGDPARLTAEGRGEADPIGNNATAAGREQNRRIEVVLHRTSARP